MKNIKNILLTIIFLFFLVKCIKDNRSYEPTKKNNDKTISDKTNKIDICKNYPTPENGFSPYKNSFGNGVYNNSSGNSFIIKNSNSSHVVVLLINAYTNKKIRNEFIRKGEKFSMTGVPNGTYYLKWMSGNDWCPTEKIGNLNGGFKKDLSFSESAKKNDWMKVSGFQEWTITLYTISNGNMDTQTINESDFGS